MTGLTAYVARTFSRPSDLLFRHHKAEPYLKERVFNHLRLEPKPSQRQHDGRKGLLDIPAELRLMIYSFLSSQQEVHQLINTDMNRIETSLVNSSTNALASLSRTCWAIHHEVNDKLYSHLRVTFQGWPDSPALLEREAKAIWESLRSLPRHLKHVRHIAVWLHFGLGSHNLLAYAQDVKPIIPALRNAAKLETFEFALTLPSCFPLEESTSVEDGEQSLKTRELERAEALIAQLLSKLEEGHRQSELIMAKYYDRDIDGNWVRRNVAR